MHRYHLWILISFLLITGIAIFPYEFNKKSDFREVQYLISGGMTPNSVNIVTQLSSASRNVRIGCSTNRQFDTIIYSEEYKTGEYNIVKGKLAGLQPGKKYYYRIESEGIPDTSTEDIGSFTLPQSAGFSYNFVLSSCSRNSSHPVFKEMLKMNPLFYINMGDIHYGDPGSDQTEEHINAYKQLVLEPVNSRNLLQNVPIAYVWDDHDYCGNNSNVKSAGRQAAINAYKIQFPHYPLGSANSIYHSFTMGRVRFVISDLRSERTETSIMTAAQMDWLKREFLNAKDENQIIAWVSPVSWSGNDKDNWGHYKKQRKELAEFLRDNEIRNLFILCGDAHMLAIDNGDNTDFSAGKKNQFKYPLFQASALNNTGTNKGGQYSEGAYPNPTPDDGQFGLVSVEDKGSEICIEFKGYRVEAGSNALNELLRYRFCRELKKPALSYQLYPNPARNELNIRAEGETPLVSAKLELYDLQGKKHYETELNFGEFNKEVRIDLPAELKGVYLLNIHESGNQFRSKIMIMP